MPEAQPRTLHHVGFVVAAIVPAMEGFLRSLNASWDQLVFEDPHQKVKVAFLSTRAGEPQIELVEPVGEKSPVLKFLLEKGGGLHHFCYETDDLKAEVQEFRSRGAVLVRPPLPAVAFSGRRIAWVLTREKLLVELLERAL
ncbi:MAG TPA: VOC family protein [Bryobacteraceae bacterium]|jgi:methylmalonyl-CoA/ethylmalonyl-CoA epimerase